MAKNIAIAYSMKKKKYPKGEEKGVNAPSELSKLADIANSKGERGQSRAGFHYERGSKMDARNPNKKEALEDAKMLHKQTLSELKEDKTDRKNLADGGAVGCPKCGYSEGGEVANDTDMTADTLPNEFDELVLSGGLEADSIVKRAMKKKYK